MKEPEAAPEVAAPVVAAEPPAVARGAGGMGMVSLPLAAGNAAIAQRMLARRRLARDPPKAPAAPTTQTAPAAPAVDQAVLDREDRAIKALGGLRGGSAGTFIYDNPNKPEYQSQKKPPSATVTIGDLVLRPTNDDQKRRSFESQGAATAYATMAMGAAGAAVMKWDDLWFVATLSAASASELKRTTVYRFKPANSVVAAIGTDRYVFTDREYTPDAGVTGLQTRPEGNLARGAEALELRALLGMGPGGGKAGMTVPAGQEEAFIRSYLTARAIESLDQNRQVAVKLAADFKPQEGGKLGGGAKNMVDQSRELGNEYAKLEAAEVKVAEGALELQEKHRGGHYGYIRIKGQRKKYFDWMDDINARLRDIATAKENVLAMSPLLSSMVYHERTPTTTKDWAAKLGWERSTTRTVLRAVTWPLSAIVDKVEKSALPGPSFKESELSKAPSEESDKKVADEFRRKLDGVQQAISKTFAKATEGDVDYLLGLSGLRSRVQADINNLGPQNQPVKDKYKEMLASHEMREQLEDIAGTAVSIGALFLPGGQFISAAIGLGMQMRSMSKHMDQWEAGQAAVDPTKALADQQASAKALLLDTIMLAIQAADLAVSVKGALDDLAAGRTPKDFKDEPKTTNEPPGAVPKAAGDPAAPGGLKGDMPGTLNMPATATGLADPAVMSKYGAAMKKLESEWAGLAQPERLQRVSAGVNQGLVERNIPSVHVVENPKVNGAQFNFNTWTVEIGSSALKGANPEVFADMMNKAYHEARHAEQWYLMARLEAGKGTKAADIGTKMGIKDPFVLENAVKNPLTKADKEFTAANQWWESVYGSGANARNQLLGVDLPAASKKYGAAEQLYIKTRSDTTIPHVDRMKNYNDYLTARQEWEKLYREYRALPEEVDAWGVGHAAEFGFRPPGPSAPQILPPPPIP